MPLPACRTVVELLGYSGQFDYLEFVAEYAPFDLYSLDNIGRATNSSGLEMTTCMSSCFGYTSRPS